VTCFVCGGDFASGDWHEPRYPCDCGAMATRADVKACDDNQREAYDQMRAEWLRVSVNREDSK
jgi:hypothetical protein